MAKKAPIYDDLSKEERISQRIAEFSEPFANIGEVAMRIVYPLINTAGFMYVTIEELQKAINENGVIDKYQNGANQYGTKKSAEVEIYLTMSKNFASIIKQLFEMVPDAETTPAGERLKAFIEKR